MDSRLTDDSFAALCRTLAAHAGEIDATGQWPAAQLRLLGDAGVFRWFVPQHLGGDGWSQRDLLQAYLLLARSCLTTTFIVTQRQGAVGRIAASGNQALRDQLLPSLLSGRTFATVGISHLTTSHRHVARPVLRANDADGGFVLDGFSPWVTGAGQAQHVVVGATLEDGKQLLMALPTDLPGVRALPPEQLVAISASHTGRLVCDNVFVDRQWLLEGPIHDVMKQGVGARTGGLQTSALAIGLSAAAIEFLEGESANRSDLAPPADSLRQEHEQLADELLQLSEGCGPATPDDIRSRANSLALRSTQAALAAAKGAGFVASHPTGRWCREALFFLVWSCPQNVLAANLCEFAGVVDSG